MPSRIYVVRRKETADGRLVRASHRDQALRHVAEDEFEVAVATQDDLVRMVELGIKPETAGGKEAPPDGADLLDRGEAAPR